MIPARLAAVLRLLAAARGFDRGTLATRAGISPSYVTLLLATPPRRRASATVIGALAVALRVPQDIPAICRSSFRTLGRASARPSAVACTRSRCGSPA